MAKSEGKSRKRNKKVYLVLSKSLFDCVEAVCLNKRALESFLESKRRELEGEVNSERLTAIVSRQDDPDFFDCTIGFETPSYEFLVMTHDIEDSKGLDLRSLHKVWVVYCTECFGEVHIYTDKATAEKSQQKWDCEEEPYKIVELNVIR